MPTHPPALTYSAHAYDDFDPLSVEHHNTYTDPLLVDQLVDTSGQDIRDLLPKPRIMEGFGIVNFGKWCMFDLDPPILGSAPSHYLERRSRSVCWELFMQSYALTYFFNDLIQDSASRCKYIKEAEVGFPISLTFLYPCTYKNCEG